MLSRLRDFGTGFGLALVAASVRLLLELAGQDVAPFAPMLLAVATATWLAGRAGGLACLTTGALSAALLFLGPVRFDPLTPGEAVNLVVYVATGVALIAVIRTLRATRGQADRSAEALDESRERLRSIFAASSEGLAICKAMRDDDGAVVDYQVLDVNPAHARLTGATREQMLAKPVSQIAPPVDPKWYVSADKALTTGEPNHFEVRSPATGCWLDIRVSPISGDLFCQTFVDITDRRELGEQRERMMAEMNHRVKNNFQMVASLLRVQSARLKNAEASAALMAAENRVHVLAALHDTLAYSADVEAVDFAAYLESLCQGLACGTPDPDAVRIVVQATPAHLPTSRAAPLGFVLNEVVTNALKYAFEPGTRGTIKVTFERVADGHLLTISDDGRGMGEARNGGAKVNGGPSGGLGSRLIADFIRQAGGTLQIADVDGVTYLITLPDIAPASAEAPAAK